MKKLLLISIVLTFSTSLAQTYTPTEVQLAEQIGENIELRQRIAQLEARNAELLERLTPEVNVPVPNPVSVVRYTKVVRSDDTSWLSKVEGWWPW